MASLLKHIPNLLYSIFKRPTEEVLEYEFEESKKSILVDTKKLKKFNHFFGYKDFNKIHSSFWYPAIFEIHLSLMLKVDFPIPLMGLVHVFNKIDIYQVVSTQLPLDYKVNVKFRAGSGGSIIVESITEIYQADQLVVKSESHNAYLSSKKSEHHKKDTIHKEFKYKNESDVISFASNLSNRYAVVSGDKNPIHLSDTLAKLFGFKQKVLHGWCSISTVIAYFEQHCNWSIVSFSVKFIKPVFLPNNVIIDYTVSADGFVNFRLRNVDTSITFLVGEAICSNFANHDIK